MRTGLLRVLTAAVLAAGLLLTGATSAQAATRPVRLEAGPQVAYRFAASGAIIGRKAITLSGPSDATTDRRRVVPTRAGIFMRLTSGTLSGFEVRESAVAYIPGKAGDTAYSPPATVSFSSGGYLGYRFDGAWDLASTRFGTVTKASTATTTRRAVIDGRPYVLMASGPWAGTWIPVTAPRGLTAQRLTCSVPAKPAAGSSVILRRIATDESGVALTFDMGGRLTPALDIMERLVIDRVCATIFPTGDAAVTGTGMAVLTMVTAHPELFEVGNHTVHHCNLRDGGVGAACPTGPATTERIAHELRGAEATVSDLTGMSTAPYWRPPYGAYDTRVRTAAADVGYTKTVMWHIDTIDWRKIKDGGPTAAAIASKVVAGAETGSIVLMHLGGYHTFDALPSMVVRLRADDLQPTSISDLLE